MPPRQMPPGMIPIQMPGQIQRPPTDAELAEVNLVREMQVRTEAAKLAVAIIVAHPTGMEDVIGLAKDIAAFILGDSDGSNDDPAPLRP